MEPQDNTSTYNLVTYFFLGMTGLVVVFTVLIAAGVMPAGPLEPETPEPTPTRFVPLGLAPTAEPQATLTYTPTFTWTPSPTWTERPTEIPTNTLTPTSTLTLTPSLSPTTEPSATVTFTWTPSNTPTERPTDTLTPTLTFTPTVSPTPSETPAPIIYQLDALSPQYITARLYGCEWQGIVGEVRGANNIGVTIRVFDSSGAEVGSSISGNAQQYGAGGYEIKVADAASAGSYQIQAVSSEGISERENLIFSGSCDQNMAIVNFERR